MTNTSILAAFERMWLHVVSLVGTKSDASHTHDEYVTKNNPVFTGSISLGRKDSTTVAEYSVAEGYNNTAEGRAAHAEGEGTTASSQASHAEGYNTTASNLYAHAEGNESVASGRVSHAEGGYTVASGQQSHAEGFQTIAASTNQHVQGKWNVEDSSDTYAHIVGNGSSDARSNAHTVDWDGNAWFAGNLYLGGTSQDDALIKGVIVHNSTTNLPEVVNGAILIAYEA